MSVPSVNKQDILNACKYIDEHGTPEINKSTKYDLVTDDGKKYPPKYVIAIANYLGNR